MWHLPSTQLFIISDLYDRKDLPAVLRHLWAITSRLQPYVGSHVPVLRPPRAPEIRLPETPTEALICKTTTASITSVSGGPMRNIGLAARSQSVPAQRTEGLRVRVDHVEKLLSDVAREQELDAHDSRIAAARRALSANAYDSLVALQELTEGDLLRLQPPVPHRVARAVARRLSTMRSTSRSPPCCFLSWWRAFCCWCCCSEIPRSLRSIDIEAGSVEDHTHLL